MIWSNFVKYFFVFALFLLNACECPKELAPKKIGPLESGSGQGIQEMVGNLMGTVYFNAVFGKPLNDGTKGLIGGRDFATGIMGKMYKSIVQSSEYRAVYYLLFIMFLVIFGIKFAIGATKMTAESVIPILIRVGVISLFTNPNISSKNGLPMGWEYYFDFFIEPSLYAMEDFAMHFQAALYGWNIKDISNGFLPMTIVLGIFAHIDTWVRIISLIFSSPIAGFCCFLMMLFCILMFFITTFFSILTFASILTMLSLLFATGPFFFLFALFDKTRKYFFKWLMQIISFLLQQYALFVTISIFGFIISECIRTMLNFDVRCDTILTFTIGLPVPSWLKLLMPFLDLIRIQFPLAKSYVANLYGDSAFVTIAFYGLFIYMLTQVFLKMMLKMVEYAGGLVAGTYSPASAMSDQMGDAAKGLEGLLSKAGSAIGEAGGGAMNKINSKINEIKKQGSDKIDEKAGQGLGKLPEKISSNKKDSSDMKDVSNNNDKKDKDDKKDTPTNDESKQVESNENSGENAKTSKEIELETMRNDGYADSFRTLESENATPQARAAAQDNLDRLKSNVGQEEFDRHQKIATNNEFYKNELQNAKEKSWNRSTKITYDDKWLYKN